MAISTRPPEAPKSPTSPTIAEPVREPRDAGSVSFAEQALRLGGKTAEEARRTGAIDAADEQVEKLFAPEYQTVNSPLHRAVWERSTPLEAFLPQTLPVTQQAQRVMRDSLELVRRRVLGGSIYDGRGKISEHTLRELAEVGYWGLLVETRYGGASVPFSRFASFLTEMATIEPTVAGLASVHGCIGAVDPVQTFGSEQQKARILPLLASGERLSAFALTEPCAGSDLTALRTTARRHGDSYLVNGEKLFITNVRPGRTIGLVCQIEQRPAVLIADLPPAEDEHFQLKAYRLHALRRAHNYGILFHDFRVPAENLLQPVRGDGLTIAYHGLNRGRVSLCATAAGVLRRMLAEMIPWVRFRRTYGEAIGRRELVRARVARLAGFIVGCDALSQWCAGLLDRGFRGEMECIVAKVFASESQKEAAIEICMKTHGGRFFLRGHPFGDDMHDLLAPCIYEGEGEMLCMALFKSLVKDHAERYFEPIGRILQDRQIRRPNLLNPRHWWALRDPLARYSGWWLRQQTRRGPSLRLPPLPTELAGHAEFAASWLAEAATEISATMRKHQLKLPDRQCRMAELSQRVQTALVILVTSLAAARQEDEIVRLAAESLCAELTRRLTGRRPTDGELRRLVQTGEAIVESGFPGLAAIPTREILMPYPADV